MITVSEDLSMHINDKVIYHEKLLKQNLATEEYLTCAYHRDEIKRLKAMLEKV